MGSGGVIIMYKDGKLKLNLKINNLNSEQLSFLYSYLDIAKGHILEKIKSSGNFKENDE